MLNKLRVASLFCGCGGSDLGTIGGFFFLDKSYAELPFEIVFAIDNNAHAISTYNANFTHHALCQDITKTSTEDMPDFDVLIGGFPCQSFSTVNPTKNTNDARANLYKEIIRILISKQPRFFICENVKGLLTLQKGSIIKKIVKEFGEAGYHVQYQLLNAASFGVPQKRERLIVVGIRQDQAITYHYPKATCDAKSWTPLRKVIPIVRIPDTKYYFSEKAVQGMKNAKNNMKRGLSQNLEGPCLTITSHLAKVSINSRDPVLLVDGSSELYRRFTPREAASIQSFPNDFSFPVSETQAYKQIGNAVPPILMWHVMKSLASSIFTSSDLYSNLNIKDKTPPDFKAPLTRVSARYFEQMTFFDKVCVYRTAPLTFQGTYRKSCRKWIVDNNLYNLLLTKEEFNNSSEFATVERLLLTNGNLTPLYFLVTSFKWVTKSKLAKMGYPVNKKHSDSTTYLLYSLTPCSDPIPKPEKLKSSQKRGKLL